LHDTVRNYVFVTGLVVLIYLVGMTPAIHAVLSNDETAEILFQMFTKKREDISYADCSCVNETSQLTTINHTSFRPSCMTLLATFGFFIALFVILPGEGSFKYLLYAFYAAELAMCCLCPWAFLLSFLISH
jgi:hypothetical protein